MYLLAGKAIGIKPSHRSSPVNIYKEQISMFFCHNVTSPCVEEVLGKSCKGNV